MFSPARVVTALSAAFGTDTACLNYREEVVFKKFHRILEDGIVGQIYFEDEDSDNEVMEEKKEKEWIPSDEPEETYSFGDKREISEKELVRALDYYRQPVSGSRSLSSMKKSFRWIKTDSDLRKLRRFESNGRNQRSYRIRDLSNRIYEQFLEKRKEGATMDDDAIRVLGESINYQHKLVDGFQFSHTWMQNFKGAYRITHRKATKIVSVLNMKNHDAILAQGKKFVEDTRALIETFPLHAVVNCDQSGFVKEFMCNRTLEVRGVKTVRVSAQSKSATTHSYTVLPSLRANGTLADKIYVVMSESTGKFPQKGHIHCPNLIVRPAKTHMMTKALMLDWVQQVAPSTPQKQLLIVDSWSSFKDHLSMQSMVPPGKELTIVNIPDGATGFCQPLDIFFFGPFKKVMKKLTNHIKCNYSTTIKVYTRDTSLQMLSLSYTTFSELHAFKESSNIHGKVLYTPMRFPLPF